MITMITNIIKEMVQGNFSFLILVVGIMQWLEMRKKNKETKVTKENKENKET